jgi:DNA-binding IclR family transcriptional regulator
MKAFDNNPSHVQSVARALQVLDLLADENKEMSLTEISNKMNWPKSTIHGILTTLRDYRLVDQSAANGRYRLGVRLFEYGQKVANSWDIRSVAMPVMRELNRVYGEMVQLATEDSGEVLYIEKLDSTRIIRIVSEVGVRLPMHCSGLGKVLLAYKSPGEVKQILTKNGMTRLARSTITDMPRMKAELEMVRKQGYAVDNCETMDGLRCVAAPIRDRGGEVAYALSISGLAEMLSGEYFEKLCASVVKAADEISQLMGYREN